MIGICTRTGRIQRQFESSSRSLWYCELRYHYNARRIKVVAALLHIYLIVKYWVYKTTVMNILSENFLLNSQKTYDSIFFKLDLSNREYQYIAVQVKLPLVLYFSRVMWVGFIYILNFCLVLCQLLLCSFAHE